MKLYVRTLNDQGQEFLLVELPEHFLELAFVPEGEEPGGSYDLVVEHADDSTRIEVRAREGQLQILPRAANSVLLYPGSYLAESGRILSSNPSRRRKTHR